MENNKKLKENIEQLKRELAVQRAVRRSESWPSVANNLVKWTGLVAITYFIYLSVDSLSGHTTIADIGVQFLGDVNVSVFLAWFFGLSSILYGFKQRKLRKDTIERLQSRNVTLEKEIHPGRSSSSVDSRGNTLKENKL